MVPASLLPLEELLLSATCAEEGGRMPEIYLNGELLKTSGIDLATGQGNNVLHYDLATFGDRLSAGTNWIAVKLLNTWQPSWDDVAFDLSLRVIGGRPAQARFQSIRREPGAMAIGLWLPERSSWRLESTDTLSPPSWRWVDSISNAPSALMWLKDSGQRGREAPHQVPNRFYRVRVSDPDSDFDGVTDWEESVTGTDIGPLHYRTNFPTSTTGLLARLASSNIVNVQVVQPVANVTRQTAATTWYASFSLDLRVLTAQL